MDRRADEYSPILVLPMGSGLYTVAERIDADTVVYLIEGVGYNRAVAAAKRFRACIPDKELVQ